MIGVPVPSFRHLLHLSDERGVFEHAELGEVRRDHGYCVDDMARVLVVTSRTAGAPTAVHRLEDLALRFVHRAVQVDGRVRNRMDERGRWHGRATVEDCWGRAVWALGTAASRSDRDVVRQAATATFRRAVQQRSPWPRARAYAALGAAEVAATAPHDHHARRLLLDAAEAMPTPGPDPAWPWPERRLAYANAVLPEAMIATGVALGREPLVLDGLALLRWLLDHETGDGHLSPTPAGGDGPGDPRPAFDQQPIEVAALTEACARAAVVDPGGPWAAGVRAGAGWFLGENDGGHPLYDAGTGGGFDGLEVDGVNRNQGAESTLAAIATLGHGRHWSGVAA